jgi:hypothetical protein
MEAHHSLTSFRTTRGHSSITPGLSSLQETGGASVRNTAQTIRTIPSENTRVSRTQHSSTLGLSREDYQGGTDQKDRSAEDGDRFLVSRLSPGNHQPAAVTVTSPAGDSLAGKDQGRDTFGQGHGRMVAGRRDGVGSQRTERTATPLQALLPSEVLDMVHF